LKIEILEKWEKKELFGLTHAQETLIRNGIGVNIDFDENNLCYCDIVVGILTREAYSLILHLTK
jgi:hypothetical protein